MKSFYQYLVETELNLTKEEWRAYGIKMGWIKERKPKPVSKQLPLAETKQRRFKSGDVVLVNGEVDTRAGTHTLKPDNPMKIIDAADDNYHGSMGPYVVVPLEFVEKISIKHTFTTTNLSQCLLE